MKNEAKEKPFPENLFDDLGVESPKELADDFVPTYMYVLYSVAPPRDVKVMMLRYRSGKNFDEIAEALNITKQRAHAIVSEVLGRLTSEHAEMLSKGMKKYYDTILVERADSIAKSVSNSEREMIKTEAYASGLKAGRKAEQSEGREGTPIENLGFSTRLYNACVKNGLETLGDILTIGDDIMNCRFFGKTCFVELASILNNIGIVPKTFFPATLKRYGGISE